MYYVFCQMLTGNIIIMTIILNCINLCKLQIVEEQFKEYTVFHLGCVSFSDDSNGVSVTFDSILGWKINFRDISYTKVSTTSNIAHYLTNIIILLYVWHVPLHGRVIVSYRQGISTSVLFIFDIDN